MAIQNFSSKETQKFFETGKLGKGVEWASLKNVARRKPDILHYAAFLNDLKSTPGNCLEALQKDLRGFHSIRINDQWRIIFRWTALGPSDVSIVDYH